MLSAGISFVTGFSFRTGTVVKAITILCFILLRSNLLIKIWLYSSLEIGILPKNVIGLYAENKNKKGINI